MSEQFKMIAKTLTGLEDVLAEELRGMGALNVETGRRMVQFEGDMAMLYRANLACRTALRILKPIAEFRAADTDQLYDAVKSMDWSQWLTVDKTFSVDPVVYSDDFPNSRFVTYRVKDAIADWFEDRMGRGNRPGVRLDEADVRLNVHIAGDCVTLSLDSSGESLHKRGYRVAQTDAPINEVLAAGILLKSGYRGDCPLVDPMCGSGTFLVEGALIAANIMPGIYRKSFAFRRWPDFDAELFDSIYDDDSQERDVRHPIVGTDLSVHAISMSERNLKSAGIAKYVTLTRRAIAEWTEGDVPEPGTTGILVTNPPYGKRLKPEDLGDVYAELGRKLKFVFKGYHAWVIGMRDEEFAFIGLTPSQKEDVKNGDLDCQLREYVSFDGDYRTFKAQGGSLGKKGPEKSAPRRPADRKGGDKKPFGRKPGPKRPETPGERFKRRFDAADDRKRKFDAPDTRKRKFDGTRPPKNGESENPFAHRHNPGALKFLENRKGWRKSDPEKNKD